MDEALLRCAQQEGQHKVILRNYGWDRPSVSIGYFQRRAVAESVLGQHAARRFIVRRPTGGGLVDHSADWTYAMIFPEGVFSSRENSYRCIHAMIREVLANSMGCPDVQELAKDDASRGRIASCFAEPSAFDVMSMGQKIAGAAQRRFKGWILHQGSVHWQGLEREETRSDFTAAFVAALQSHLDASACVRELTHEEASRASDLFMHQYASDAWNHKF